MKLYLYNQTRDRDLDEYIQKLNISSSEFDKLNTSKTNILLVGGGFSPIQPKFIQTLFHITNIDFNPSEYQTEKLHQISGDFLTKKIQNNFFDEVWALCSLPLYAQQTSSVDIFFAKSILALKPGGFLRAFPIEFNSYDKLVTRDAEWEISTPMVTGATMDFLSELQPFNVSIDFSLPNKNNEKAVIVKIPKDIATKSALDNKMIEIIKAQVKNMRKLSKIQIQKEP